MTAVLEAPVRRGFAPRGLVWLMWRQRRLSILLWPVVVLAAAVAAVWLHGASADYIRNHGIAGCAMISLDPACQQPGVQESVSQFRDSYGHLLKLAGLLMLLLPVAVGAGLGAPLLAQELEQGTWKLVLSQSVSRRRWVLAKLAGVAVPAALGSLALASLYRWAWHPSANDVSGIAWSSQFFFSTGGPDLVATVLAAIGVGALAGAVLRRTVPAMAVTVLLVGLLQAGLSTVRPYLWSWQTMRVPESELPNSVWGFAHGLIRPDGTRLPYDGCGALLDPGQCAAKYAGTVEYSDVHRATDYWPLQLVETGICLALAALLTAATVSWIRRRLA
ncbi:ABC transporter permease [Streptomyces tateyamensis]|uniref:ABC transporter permease n=1 Tax=Streptomyces tateyamensis TaxID=565073 RepID=A0A2V4PSX8_9ACTN|nr:ABC transporter permease subunit [Streptomyces tateyamensis]PYC88229.1 ABC transporter permease [Streptomyces tateyamensis]